MAMGTGLPGERGQVATTITDMDAYGAGEEAAARALAQAADGLAGLVQVIEPAAREEAKTIAEQKVAAGEFQQRVAITGADQAFNEAMRTGTMARLSNQRDADLDRLQIEHAFDPDGFERAAADYRTSALNAAVPGALAMEWGADFDARAGRTLSTIRAARAEADIREAKGATEARIERLTSETIALGEGRSLAETLADETVQGNLLQIQLQYEGLAGNPAFGMSEEEANLARDEVVGRIKAGAVAAEAVSILRTEGSDAALARVQSILTDDSLPLTRAERTLAFNTARDAVNQDLNIANQRRNQAAAEQSEREREIMRMIDEDVALVELTGEGSGLTAEQVRAAGGNAAVSRWLKARADAAEFNAITGDLPVDDPQAAAALIANRTASRGFTAMGAIQDEGDLATLANAIIQVESGGRNGLVSEDPDGAGPAGGGAYGLMQILPTTAETIARGLGIRFDADNPADVQRLRTDTAFNRQLGQAYLNQLLDRYNGDAFLAVTAYHAGEGNVDGWIRSIGDPRGGAISREAWLAQVEARGNPRSAEYPRKVLAALNGGQAAAAWDAYRGNRESTLADPAGAVQTDFAVRAAREAWQANPRGVGPGMAFVDANLAAQERQNIPQGRRRSLPVSTLAIYAGDLERFQRANDVDGFNGYAQSIVRQFGRHGQRVLQDVLEVRGNTRYAAQVTARLTQQQTLGQRPSSGDVQAAATAARTERIATAANGTARDVTALSDAELLAAAGLGQ